MERLPRSCSAAGAFPLWALHSLRLDGHRTARKTAERDCEPSRKAALVRLWKSLRIATVLGGKPSCGHARMRGNQQARRGKWVRSVISHQPVRLALVPGQRPIACAIFSTVCARLPPVKAGGGHAAGPRQYQPATAAFAGHAAPRKDQDCGLVCCSTACAPRQGASHQGIAGRRAVEGARAHENNMGGVHRVQIRRCQGEGLAETSVPGGRLLPPAAPDEIAKIDIKLAPWDAARGRSRRNAM